MWKEIETVDQINNLGMSEYLRLNPVEMIVDLEDPDNENLVIKRFVTTNNTGLTMALLEFDSSLIDFKNELSGQLSNLSQLLSRERNYFTKFARSISSFPFVSGMTVMTNY